MEKEIHLFESKNHSTGMRLPILAYDLDAAIEKIHSICDNGTTYVVLKDDAGNAQVRLQFPGGSSNVLFIEDLNFLNALE